MLNAIKIALLSFLLFLCPMSLFQGYQVFILESCDPKFGCVGTFQLGLLISSLFGLVSSLSLMALSLRFHTVTFSWPIIFTSLFLGSIYQSVILTSGVFHSDISMAIAWFILCLIMYAPAVWWSRKPLVE